MRRTFLLIYSCFISVCILAQTSGSISGVIVSEADGGPLVNCSVFVNNTSRGTISNEKGEFALKNLPPGQFELIVSLIGYQSYVKLFSDKQLPLELHIVLKPKPAELTSVTVNPFIADGWNQWGRFFFDQFIGTFGNAADCTIKNKENIRFRMTDRQTKLEAVATEPLIIENRALGYIISYSLEQFNYDLTNNSLVFTGYPVYREMETKNERSRKSWEKNRKAAYLGSIHHFIRTVFANKIYEEGFTVKKVLHVNNAEKGRIKGICLSKHFIKEDTARHKIRYLPSWKKSSLEKDTLGYYKKILKQPDYFEREDSLFLEPDRYMMASDSGMHYLFFQGKLVIYYRNAPEDPGYVRSSGKMRIEKFQKSFLYITGNTPISIWPIGNYYPPLDLFVSGYWAWLGKISNRLPLDYVPHE